MGPRAVRGADKGRADRPAEARHRRLRAGHRDAAVSAARARQRRAPGSAADARGRTPHRRRGRGLARASRRSAAAADRRSRRRPDQALRLRCRRGPEACSISPRVRPTTAAAGPARCTSPPAGGRRPTWSRRCRRVCRPSARLFAWGPQAGDNPYLALLGLADRFVVTGDSISMMVEVARLGRPLAIFPLPVRKGPVAALRQALAQRLHPQAGDGDATRGLLRPARRRPRPAALRPQAGRLFARSDRAA